ncbi:biosynthetic peptidoglycan transglycosylase [Dysgonomonas gadei]|uniref:Glycosyl transferase family 51 domain-containing protein n=1 Tax=Dysgonomonas gadei ATCC BAA-286 TaxID=742766 RepID=F5ITT0_9BACT|nr:biosynthetic peptidoglycan transglycosylase [Dysgonomonas gadei]EGJ99464.1 hypothetical protein HMPREF9455_00497 [Dysgonomonas gadei ATCC BAA-286]
MADIKEQFYPTYKANEKEVLLIEFEEAQRIANGQSNIYRQLTSILLGATTILIPLFFSNKEDTSFFITINQYSIQLAILISIVGYLLLRYFVELQKTITINARKVVTLRTLLGLDYGSIQLTLPNNRVEGANNPFVIKYFKGWLKFETTPFWILFIGVNLIWYLATKNKGDDIILNIKNISIPWLIGNILISFSYLHIFRTNLHDRHETTFLNFIKILATIFQLKLVNDFEYILYRAKLAYIELNRLEVDYSILKNILVDIEDSDFYKNNKGFSIKSLIRGAISQISFFRDKNNYIKSGGSTITMQLVRTLFISFGQNKFKRKCFEILLSYWISQQFTKEEILNIYIASVQYERNVIGLAKAIKYFFAYDLKNLKLSNEESFFLIERLSNITSSVNFDRIKYLNTKTSTNINYKKLITLYESRINIGLLKNIK